jgi:hypothetical protein
VLLGITAIDFIRFIEERVELQDGFILVRQALSIFLIGLGGPRDEAGDIYPVPGLLAG